MRVAQFGRRRDLQFQRPIAHVFQRGLPERVEVGRAGQRRAVVLGVVHEHEVPAADHFLAGLNPHHGAGHQRLFGLHPPSSVAWPWPSTRTGSSNDLRLREAGMVADFDNGAAGERLVGVVPQPQLETDRFAARKEVVVVRSGERRDLQPRRPTADFREPQGSLALAGRQIAVAGDHGVGGAGAARPTASARIASASASRPRCPGRGFRRPGRPAAAGRSADPAAPGTRRRAGSGAGPNAAARADRTGSRCRRAGSGS